MLLAGFHGDFLGLLVVHCGVGLELEEEVHGVDEEEDEGGAAGDGGDFVDASVGDPDVEDGGDDD